MDRKREYKVCKFGDKLYLQICSSNEIYEGKGKRFFFGDDNDMQLAVYRVDGKLYCLNNICPHRHQDQMHKGIIQDLKVMCPAHGWTYSLVDGQNVISKQGVKSLDSFEIFEDNGLVYVEKPYFTIPKWRRSELGV